MIRFELIAALPEIFQSAINNGIIKIAIDKKLAQVFIHNLHDYAEDKFGHIDDTLYGGGSGMLIKCQPVFDCIGQLKQKRTYDDIIYMTPDGELLNQSILNELSLKKNLIILAGHYEGIDQRIRDNLITREISIGNYVTSGGELPALVLIDSIIRLVPGVLGSSESALDDSFQYGLLEPPQYTKPADFRGWKVPEVLLKGNHNDIDRWRQEQSIIKTKKLRPDLLKE